MPRLCVLLARAEREVRRNLTAALTGLELTTDEFLLLAACDVTPLPSQSELTTSVALSPAQASTLLERLRKKDWLLSERDISDRRRQVWSLSPLGRIRLDEAWLALRPALSELTARLAQESWNSLSSTLDELLAPISLERRRSA